MSPSDVATVWTFFIAAALSVATLVGALVVAAFVAQRRRSEMEREHARRVLAAQEDERSRVARELHDDALQRVAMIRHELGDVGGVVPADVRERLQSVAVELDDLGSVLRSAAHQLHPAVVEKAGLVRALASLAEEVERVAGIKVAPDLPSGDPLLAPGVGVAAYRIAQEALRNVAKHAGVGQADLRLACQGDDVILRIADAGRGFDADAVRPNDGLGLIAMRQRAEAVGGRLTCTSRPGSTVVMASFPLAAP